MQITNKEYDTIIRALKHYSDMMKYGASISNHLQNEKDANILRNKLEKEYDDIAERNIANGMTADEEEIYPSRLNTEYGGSPSGNKEVE